MQDLKQTFYALEDILYKITRKEAAISRQMRIMADQADQLMNEVDQLRNILASFPIEELQTSAAAKSKAAPSITPEHSASHITPEHQTHEPSSHTQPPNTPITDINIQADFQSQTEEIGSSSDTATESALSGPIYTDIKQDLDPSPPINNVFLDAQDSQNIDRFELDLGIKWLSRIGIVALLIGIAMALSYSFPNFTKEMKLLTGMIVASGLFFGGGKLYPTSSILGRILQGGGLSVGYLSIFAMFFIPEVQIFNAAGLGIFSLFLYVGVVLSLAHTMNSQTVALLSLAFGYYTAGYAESHMVAFLTTGILSLSTVGVTRLHQDWKILPKANLLGALVTYAIWHHREALQDELSAKVYLIYTYVLFHIVSLVRGKAGDISLNQLNSFAFYGIYSLTQPAIGPNGLLEFLIAGVQFGSLIIFNAIRPESRQSGFAIGMVLLTLLFLGFGTLKYFEGMTLSTILAAEALCLGFLSSKSEYQRTLIVASYTFFIFGFCQMLMTWDTLSDPEIMLNGFWIALCGFILEAIPFRTHDGIARGILISGCALLLLSATISAVPDEWRTISLVISGFLLLACGFFCKRKLYRWLGLGWIFLPGGISILGDMIHLTMGYKILLFILLGIGLLGGSYGYSLLEKRLSNE